MNLLSTNKRVDSMYIDPNIFSKVFREYTEKVNQKKAERIPYKSWQVLHRLDMDWPKQTGSNNICFNGQMSACCADTHNLVAIEISYIYGTNVTIEIDIPDELYTDLLKNSSCYNTTAATYSVSGIDLNSSDSLIRPNYLNDWWNTATTITPPGNGWTVDTDCSESLRTTIEKILDSTESTISKKENNNSMNIPAMKFDFGPANTDAVAMSPYGLAVRCGDSWYAYNANEGQTIDVTGMTFSFKNAIYKMPVAVNQVKEGDLIVHQKKAMYVVQVNDKTSIEVIDLAASEQKTVIPVSNMFGFNYVTKVAPLFNLGNITPSAENPFGNILPMMMMSSMFEDDKNNKSEGNDFMQMMLMMSLMNGTNPFSAMFAGAGPQAE